MHKLVLLRHGESTWNKENRFTGWTDVDLTEKGREEAKAAGQLLRPSGYAFDIVFTSLLKRAIRTSMDRARRTRSALAAGRTQLAIERAPLRRAAGIEQGGDRGEARRRAGEDLAPRLRHRAAAARARRSAASRGRSALHGLCRRGNCRSPNRSRTPWRASCPTGTRRSRRAFAAGKRVLIAAHGNSLRALVKYLDDISDDEIVELNIPTGIPLVYELDVDLKPLRHYTWEIRRRQRRPPQAVANQAARP